MWKSLFIGLLVISAPPMAVERSVAQSESQLILSKHANGVITQDSLRLTLRSNQVCDRTQRLIPDGSSLLTTDFLLDANNTGFGVFRGKARIVAPDGRRIMEGSLRGTVGVTSCGDQVRQCESPFKLEGLFEAQRLFATPAAMTTSDEQAREVFAEAPAATTTRDSILASRRPLPLATILFSASRIIDPEAQLPTYQGTLNGIVPQPLAAPNVTLTPDRQIYSIEDRIVVRINNNTDLRLDTMDGRSYCTILSLQRQAGDRWVNVVECQTDGPAQRVSIGPRQAIAVMLPPGPLATPHDPWRYRVALEFVLVDLNSNPGNAPPLVVTSQPFEIVVFGAGGVRSVKRR